MSVSALAWSSHGLTIILAPRRQHPAGAHVSLLFGVRTASSTSELFCVVLRGLDTPEIELYYGNTYNAEQRGGRDYDDHDLQS